ELLRDAALRGSVGLRHERTLHEVEVIQQTDPRNAGEEVQPAQQELRHERLRRWKRTARSAEQNRGGTASRNAGFDRHTRQDECNGANTGARATRASAAAV